MKLNPNLKVRKIVNEYIILLPSKGSEKSTKIVSLNATSNFLWENLVDKDFTMEDGVKLLTDQFDVDQERAQADFEKWVCQLEQFGAIIKDAE